MFMKNFYSVKKYNIIGIMSGTSCDGLDIAHCEFYLKNDIWNYKIINAETYQYSNSWIEILKTAQNLSAFDFLLIHNKYGEYIAEKVNNFITKFNCKIDFISSHGHTIFHQPDKGLTYQIGNGASITAKTGITTISDFRTLDVALGGQGAPLVPIGDELLFSKFDYCLNLGGFANISFNKNDKRIAFDICPVNIAINYFTSKYFNKDYDKDGNLAKKGEINFKLLEKLNSLEYYKLDFPKSLGREWFETTFLKIISTFKIDANDLLRTLYEHFAIQLASVIESDNEKTVLVTGGGAFNCFFIEIFKTKTKANIILPDQNLINFKEALIFAFLGLLRVKEIPNCLSSVTGAKKDNCGGNIYIA